MIGFLRGAEIWVHRCCRAKATRPLSMRRKGRLPPGSCHDENADLRDGATFAFALPQSGLCKCPPNAMP